MFFIVVNPGSGRKEGNATRELLERILGEAGRPFQFIPVERPDAIGQACKKAAQLACEQGGTLLAAGGDGTLNTAAEAAVEAGCPLAIVPQGTFNFFARNLGIPQDAESAIRAMLHAEVEPVQVGCVNGRLFLVNASLGLYPQLLADRETFKQQLGRRRWVAFIAGLVTLFEWRSQLVLDVELDGRATVLRTPTLFVGNNRLQMERIGIEPEVAQQVGEGRLCGIAVRPIGMLAMLRLVFKGALGQLGEARQVQSFALRSLTVRPRMVRGLKMKLAADGEVRWMRAPLRFEVSPKPLRLLMPAPADRVAVE